MKNKRIKIAVVVMLAIIILFGGGFLIWHYNSLIDINDETQVAPLFKRAEVTNNSQYQVVYEGDFAAVFYKCDIIILRQDKIFPSRYSKIGSKSGSGDREKLEISEYDRKGNCLVVMAATYTEDCENPPEFIELKQTDIKTGYEKSRPITPVYDKLPFCYLFVNEFEKSDTVYEYSLVY